MALAQIITPPGSLIPSQIQSNEVTPRQSFTTETYQNASGENTNIESDTDPIPPDPSSVYEDVQSNLPTPPKKFISTHELFGESTQSLPNPNQRKKILFLYQRYQEVDIIPSS